MHTGRRSFATNMYKRRFPTIAIMKLTGHTTESNFLRYIKVTPEENAAMMADEFFKAQQPFENEFQHQIINRTYISLLIYKCGLNISATIEWDENEG